MIVRDVVVNAVGGILHVNLTVMKVVLISVVCVAPYYAVTDCELPMLSKLHIQNISILRGILM